MAAAARASLRRQEVGYLSGLVKIMGAGNSANIGRQIVEDDVPAYIRYRMGSRVGSNMVTHVVLRSVFIPLAYFCTQLHHRCHQEADVFCSIEPGRIYKGTLKSFCRTSFSSVASFAHAVGASCCEPFEFQHGRFPYNDGRDPMQPASGGRGHLFASETFPIEFMVRLEKNYVSISFVGLSFLQFCAV
jgi:hypothetical protein